MVRESLTDSDSQIRDCLVEKKSFAMVAGAGSGKTTSLITALQFVQAQEGPRLRRDDKKVACITYTNRAVDVISSRLEWNSLFEVGTLHSFLWGEIRRFAKDIRAALQEHVLPAKIEKKKEDDNGGNSQRAIKAREQVASLTDSIAMLDNVKSFEYHDSTFSDYEKGRLGHDDVIAVAAYLLANRAPLQKMFGQRYPYIFVDEAQDTFEPVVTALNAVCSGDGLPIVGYFGDPMQQIYDRRAGAFAGPKGALRITKKENYRCSPQVIRLLNTLRTDVEQYPAGENADYSGSVSITLVAGESPAAPRNRYSEEQLKRVADRFSDAVRDWGWDDNPNVKQLFLVRQMIARRLGFTNLHRLFTGQYASTRAQEEYEQGTHYLLAPFTEVIWPLVQACRDDALRDVLKVLRRSSPAFDPEGINAEEPIRVMKEKALEVVRYLDAMWASATIREVFEFCRRVELCRISERLGEALDRCPREEEYEANQHESDKGDWLADKFLQMTTEEIAPFADFLHEHTPFSTQHGVKGEEYEDVIVVFDDIEAAWNHYSFTKVLTPGVGGSPSSESQEERTKKLAYVCFSRAMRNLRILLFTTNAEEAKTELVRLGLFDKEQVHISD